MTRCSILVVLATCGLASAADPVTLKVRWEVRLPPYAFVDKYDREKKPVAYDWAAKKIAAAREEFARAKRPFIHPNVPIANDRIVVTMSTDGPYCYSMRADANEKPPLEEGELLWMIDRWESLACLGRDDRLRGALESHYFKRESKLALAEQIANFSLNGRLFLDGNLAYYIDDFGLFPPIIRQDKAPARTSPFFSDAVHSNRIRLAETEGGKLRAEWERLNEHGDRRRGPTSFFLGPPLAIDDLLYFMHEEGQSLRLIGMDLKASIEERAKEYKGVKKNVAILETPESAATDFARRMHALDVVATDKLILCPTHLGAIVAVNRADHKIAWTARYGKLEDKRFENFASTWLVSPPLVAEKRLLYAPPDAEAIFAFDLSDGSLAWKRERGKGIYVAGLHKDRLIIVESDAVVAVNAADGREVWKYTFTGMLTGRGAFDGDRYYLPVNVGKEATEGALEAIDLKDGKVSGLLKRADKGEFGNLLIHKRRLISQTFQSLSVYDLP